MKPGEVSPIIHTNQGYWIIKVTDRKAVRKDIAFDQAKERIGSFLYQLKSRQALDDLLTGLRAGTPVLLYPSDYWN